MDLGLQGKTAIITGEKLAQKVQELGYPGKILAVSTDVTERASVDAMVTVSGSVTAST